MTRGWLLAAVLTLCGCVPWTVRPIDSAGDDSKPFDAQSYVDSIWSAKLIPALLASAKEIRELGGATGAVAVKGQGRVIAIHTQSAAGVMEVRVDGRAVSIQIGPVLRGTSLRDAAGFIRYGDFVNQLQYADVASALNDRVLKRVLNGFKPAALKGAKILFVGTGVVSNGNVGPLVPIRIEGEGP